MKLKDLREKKGITQEQFAKELNINRISLSRYESGLRQPPLETFDKICDVLDLSNKKRMELLKSMSKKE